MNIYYKMLDYGDEEWVMAGQTFDGEEPDTMDAQNAAKHFFNSRNGYEVARDVPWKIEVKVNDRIKNFNVEIITVPDFLAREIK